ncbi:hypothetical protein [Actinomyces sp. ZJ308]|uniref:hypothetical protein n=1 Tax=Actinomyces sp. ZJ308 TaxID=2708342 RepID=UPI0014225362|nr:hypothetical protein [Actinomyces sp. ZJ308]
MSARSIAHTPDHGHWTPAVPLSGVVTGRILLAILEALVVGIAVAIWSALTHTGLSSDQITGFTILATAVREALDASSMRLTMRIQRTNDMNRAERIASALTWPAIGGAIATMLFAPARLIPLTALTWAASVIVTCALDKPWTTPMSHEEMRKRSRQDDVASTGTAHRPDGSPSAPS